MSWIAVAIGGAALLGYAGSQNQANAAESSTQLQANAANQASDQQRAMFDIINAQQAPWRTAGAGGLTKINEMMPYFTQQQQAYKPFTAEDLKSNLAPNYQFMLSQGLGATAQNVNVGGGGSNVDLARTKFAEDYAGNAYQNALANYMGQQTQAFNQNQTQTSNIYNRLASIAGIGQAANTQTNQAMIGATNAIGQLGVGAAGAIGAGQVGAANAYAGGLQGIGSAGTLASLLGGGGGNPYATGQQLSNLYGSSNVYGAGGGGTNYLSGPGASYIPIGE
jgi:hypothetical protein